MPSVSTTTTSIPWGAYHYQPGLQRYRCKEKDCKRTFNDLTGTLLDGSKRSVMHWILATFLLGLSCSSRQDCERAGGAWPYSYRWSWWLRNTASPIKPTASWQAPWKPMTSTTPPVTRDEQGGEQEGVGAPRAWPAKETRARSWPL